MSATRKESAANIRKKMRLTEAKCKLNREIDSPRDSNTLNQSSSASTNSEPDLLPLLGNILKNSKESPFYGYLTLSEKVQLARHSQFSKLPGYQVPAKITSHNFNLKVQLKQLLGYVVRGEKTKAEKLIKENPKLLLEKGIAEDYSGRLIEGTAYQMALGAGDVNRAKLDEDNKPVLDEKGYIQILHPDEGMAEMIKGHFIDAFNQDEKAANSEIDKQQEGQFPGGYEVYINSREVKERRGNDMKALREVIDAIAVADVRFINGNYNNSNGEVKVDAKCADALKKFRDYLRPKGIIRRGEHFNVELLVEAFNLYDDEKRYNAFGGTWDSVKNVLMWRKMVGYIQRYLPACYAQAFSQGLYYVVDANEKLDRRFKFRHDNAYFFPLDSDPLSRMGYEYAAWRRGSGGAGGNHARSRLETYVKQKHLSIECLCRSIPIITRRNIYAG